MGVARRGRLYLHRYDPKQPPLCPTTKACNTRCLGKNSFHIKKMEKENIEPRTKNKDKQINTHVKESQTKSEAEAASNATKTIHLGLRSRGKKLVVFRDAEDEDDLR